MPDGQNAERVERLIATINDLHVVLDEDRRRLAEMVAAVEKLQHDRRKDRRWAAFAAAVVLALAGLAVWNWQQQEHQNSRSCERSVEVRVDNRAMWEWLITRVAPSRGDLATEAQDELNVRLPRLECTGDNHPVPVGG